MSRQGITQTSSLFSPPQFNTTTAFIAYSPLSPTEQVQFEFSVKAQQPEQSRCMSRFAALYTHRKIHRVLTTALIQFCGESSLIQMTSAHNCFYIHWVLAFSMLTRCAHPQVHVQNLCAHRCLLLLPVRVFYSKEKNTEPAFSPSPVSVLSSTIFLPSFPSEGRR